MGTSLTIPPGLALKAVVSFPGLTQFHRFTYTMQHGISPGVITIDFPITAGMPEQFGNLILTFGDTTITIYDCKLDNIVFITGQQERTLRATILDRRWKWTTCGIVNGSYNLWRDNWTLLEDTKKTPQELATLLLEAMNEEDFDVSALPNDTYPQVEWEYDSPAHELAELCDTFGCRVIINLDGNVQIVKVGVGNTLDTSSGVAAGSGAFDPPEAPSALIFVGARNRYQHDFLLVPVADEIDGTVVDVDDVSYAPDGGFEQWGDEFGYILDNYTVPAGITPAGFNDSPTADELKQRAYDLAKGSVWKKWAIVLPDGEIYGFDGDLESLWQILPLENAQIPTEIKKLPDLLNGAIAPYPKEVSKPPIVWGSYAWGNLVPDKTEANTTDGDEAEAPEYPGQTIYKGAFSLDADLGIVTFGDAVYFEKNDGSWQFPDLRLRCAFSIRDLETRSWIHYERKRELSDTDTAPRYILRDDVIFTQYELPEGDDPVTNESEVQQAADYYLDSAQAEYQVTDPMSITYNGWRPIALDGAIQSVTWSTSIDPPGPLTHVSRNNEWGNPQAVPYKQRRAIEKMRAQQRKKGSPTSQRRSIGKEGQP